MKLELIRNKPEEKIVTINTTEEFRFKFIKNMIKKDLEVVCWVNKAVAVFGDLEIYSDPRAEVNSFEYVVSLLTRRNFELETDNIEGYISGKCTEYFLNRLILQKHDFDSDALEELSIKFTKYLLEATNYLNGESDKITRENLFALDQKYFGENIPISWKHLDLQYLN